jgi:hypothetical protein
MNGLMASAKISMLRIFFVSPIIRRMIRARLSRRLVCDI